MTKFKLKTPEEAQASSGDLNIVVETGHPWKDIVHYIFGTEDNKEFSLYVTKQQTYEDLLTELGIYKSKGEVRRAGKGGKIQEGYTDTFKASKKLYMTVFKPNTPQSQIDEWDKEELTKNDK